MLRRRHLQAAAGAAIMAIGIGASTLGASASSPVATARPRWGLTNGATTWVSGGDFPPSTTVAIVQCNKKVATLPRTKAEDACDTSHPVLVTTTSTGRVPARAYKVVEGTIGTSIGKGPCDHTHSCFMIVSTLPGATPSADAIAPINFK